MATNDTYLAVFLGSKNNPRMQAFMALPEAERRAKEQEGIAAWKAWIEKNQAAVSAMGGPLGKTKKVTPRGIEDVSNEMGAFMVVRAESPIRSLKDIEASLRKDAGSLSFGGASLGNSDHITVATFAKSIGVDPTKLTYIPYSGGESNPAIIGGHVDVGMGGLDLITHVESGRMRVLAISSPKRLGGRFQKMPTFVEQGYDVVNENWRGLFGPPEMPPSVLQYWKNALTQMVQSPAWRAELEKNQWVNTFEADGFRASLDRDNASYAALLKQLGLTKQ